MDRTTRAAFFVIPDVGYYKTNDYGENYFIRYCQYASDYAFFNGKCAYNFRYETEDYSWFAFRRSDEYIDFYSNTQRWKSYMLYTEVRLLNHVNTIPMSFNHCNKDDDEL